MSEWARNHLVDLVEIRPSNVDKKSATGEISVRLCNYMDVYSSEYIRADREFMVATATPDEIRRFRVEVGDVMLTKDSEVPSDIGIPSVAIEQVENLVCGYHLALLKPKQSEIDSVFLAKQLSSDSTKRYFNQVANGSTRYGLTYKALAEVTIPLPPLPQQRRIADILSTVDEAIEQTERLIAKQQQIKAGLMQDLFTRGVWTAASIERARVSGSFAAARAQVGQLRPPRETAPELYKESPLGWIPKDWEVKALGTMSEIVSGVTLNSGSVSGGRVVPYLRVANVQDGYLDLSEIKTVGVTEAQFQKLKLEQGDVLMNEGGDFDKLGRGTVWNCEVEPCVHQNHVFRVRPKQEQLNSQYLAFWSQSHFGKKYFVLSSKQSTNLASINSTQLHKFPVFNPPLAEQDQIVGIIGAVVAEAICLKDEVDKLKKQKQGLMQNLLSEPSDKPI